MLCLHKICRAAALHLELIAEDSLIMPLTFSSERLWGKIPGWKRLLYYVCGKVLYFPSVHMVPPLPVVSVQAPLQSGTLRALYLTPDFSTGAP